MSGDIGRRPGVPYCHPAGLAEVLRLTETVEPALRRPADLEIDTSVPIDEVVQRLVKLVRR